MSKARLYLFVGYPGAGKTTIARMVQQATGAVHIWADLERQKMFGEPKHTAEENAKLYAVLNEQTAQHLSEGRSVIFDTNFNFRRDRDRLSRIAEEAGAEATIIWVTTPLAVARQRAVNESEGEDTRLFGNMLAEDFDRIASHLQPPAEDETVIKIDGTKVDRQELLRLLKL
jgi:predicted kinase